MPWPGAYQIPLTSRPVDIAKLLSLPNLRQDLIRVDDALRASVTSDDPLLAEVAAHLILAGGKRLRPSMAIAAALTAHEGPVPEAVIKAAAAVELVHLGSLYHDDVLDGAETRRTVESANARYGNFLAIIAGDFLLARSSSIAADLGTEATHLLAATISELCQGQVWEQRFCFRVDRSIDDYHASIAGKTASLIGTSARMGALSAELPITRVIALETFGRSFGMAFQIRDDVLDIIGTDEQLGKPAGNDLVEGVYTLPVIYALADRVAGPELRALLGGTIEIPERDKARDIVRNSGAVKQAIAKGNEWATQAVVALENAHASDMTESLRELANSLFDGIGT